MSSLDLQNTIPEQEMRIRRQRERKNLRDYQPRNFPVPRVCKSATCVSPLQIPVVAQIFRSDRPRFRRARTTREWSRAEITDAGPFPVRQQLVILPYPFFIECSPVRFKFYFLHLFKPTSAHLAKVNTSCYGHTRTGSHTATMERLASIFHNFVSDNINCD